MGLHSNTTENDTSPPSDVSMLSTIVEEKMDVNSCPSSVTSCVSPNQTSNGGMDGGYDEESSENMKNGNCEVAIMEADSNTGNLKENVKESDKETEETEFPHEPGKIFIGGLNPCTTIENLKFYFRKYGEIKNSLIMRDIVTKKSRGFGFVTFVDPNVVEQVLNDVPHTLDSKRIEPKIAVPKQAALKASHNALIRTKKIFVGGLPQNTKEEDLVNFFSQYGAVDHADLIREKENGRFRGFGFVYFMSEVTAERVIHQKYFWINDKKVEVKKALPKEVLENQNAALQAAVSIVSGSGANTYLGPTINNPSVAPVAAGPPNPALTPLPIPPNYLQTTALNDSANPTLSVTQPSASQVPQQPRLPLPTNLSYTFGQEPITQLLLSSMQTAQTTPYPNTQPLMYNPSTFMTDFAQLPYGGLNPAQVIQSLNANTQTGYYNQVPMPTTQQLDPFVHYYAQLSQQLNPTATALLQQIQAGHAIRFPIPTAPTPIATNTITYDQAIASNDRLAIPMPTAQPAAIQQGPRLNTYGNANGQGTSSSTPKPSNSTEKQPSASQPKADLVDVASSSMPAKMPRTQ